MALRSAGRYSLGKHTKSHAGYQEDGRGEHLEFFHRTQDNLHSDVLASVKLLVAKHGAVAADSLGSKIILDGPKFA